MISEQEARDKVLENVKALPSRRAALTDALDLFSAEDLAARIPLPVFDNSAMDGYAIVAGEKKYRVIGEQPAGLDRQLQVGPGQAVRIFTGAPIPSGADAVVMQEDVTRDGEFIKIKGKIDIGDFIRRTGCDLSLGQKILGKGDRITPTILALLASQGISELNVGGELTAAVISTGDELAKVGDRLQPGQIYESNSVLLGALLQKAGAKVRSVENCRDDFDLLSDAIKRGAKESVLIISGGVSVGAHDFVQRALESLGAKIDIWRVAIKPGKPFLFARLNDCLIFGLPGNPVSSFVTFLRFVRPALRKMMSAADLYLPCVRAKLIVDLTNNDERRPHYVRGKYGDGIFSPVGRQESHALYGLSQSNALMRVPAGGDLLAGSEIDVEIWE